MCTFACVQYMHIVCMYTHVSVCLRALVYMCVFVHCNVVGDSADRCVMTAYHCPCARVRVAGGPFWHVFSPRLHLCLWHAELGLTKAKQGGEIEGMGWGGGVTGCGMSEAGWGKPL